MQELTVDVAVIGAGTAGLTAYRAAKAIGAQVVLIEGGPYGTTCARVGCMPSKLLIAAADAAQGARQAAAFGVQASAVQIDGHAVMKRVRSERNRFVSFVLNEVQQIPSADRLRGYARFTSADQLLVGDHTVVRAKRIVIATGSRPRVPMQLRHLGAHLITSDELFELDTLPESIAVVGTGVLGLELGQALHHLGVRTTLFGRSQAIAQLSDPEVQAAAKRYLSEELDIRLGATLISAEPVSDGVVIHSRNQHGEESREHYQVVLAAAGRLPNIEGLGLEHTGLARDDAGIPLFDPLTMQCSDQPIFIAGDANNERPLLHEAADQGRIAGTNAVRYPQVEPGLRHTLLSIAFTDPQIAVVGQSYRTLPAGRYVVGQASFEGQGRSRVILQNRGLLRIYAAPGSGQFLGAEMIGPQAEHLAHLLAWASQSEMTIDQMLKMPFYHPVIEEGLRSALRNTKEALRHGLPEIERCAESTPGT